MIVIFEGPDYSGKDHLINSIREESDKYSTMYFYNSVYKSQAIAMKAFKGQLYITESIFNNTYGKAGTFFNRFHISSAIYGSVVRGERLMYNQYNEIEKTLSRLNAQIILCLPPKDIVLKGWEDRLDEEYVKDKDLMSQVYDEYCQIENYTSLPIVKHDFSLGRYTE